MRPLLYAVALTLIAHAASAAFVENFKEKTLPLDKAGVSGWMTLAGSGEATVHVFNIPRLWRG